MGLALKINGEWLDLLPNTSISFELNNPAYLGDDTDVILGSFSFPSEVPLSARNRKAIKFTERLDNAAAFAKDLPSEVWIDGIMLFPCLATVTEAMPGRAKVTLLVGWISKLKETALNEIDLGGEVTMGTDLDEVLLYAKDTAIHPLNYNHVFFPVYNPGFLGDDDENVYNLGNVQNYWNADSQEFFANQSGVVAMPFLKLDFLLQKIFSSAGFSLVNNWQIDDELRLLTVYNNYCITDPKTGTWRFKFDPKNHVSKSKCGDFLKGLARLFNLGVFVNYFDRTASLRPLKDVLAAPVRHDWTAKALTDYTVSQSLNYPTRLAYPRMYDELAGFHAAVDGSENGIPSHWVEVDKWEDATLLPYTTILERTTNRVYYVDPDAVYIVQIGSYMPVIFESEKVPYNAGIGTVWMYRRELDDQGISDPVLLPQVQVKGTFGTERNDCPDKVMFYRGLQLDHLGHTFPLGDAMGFTMEREVMSVAGAPAKYSLYWDRERGLYEKWWKLWHTMLKQKRDVTRRFRLTVTDLRNFSFEHKVRVGNQNYFIKKLRVTLSARGIELTEAEMVTVV